MTVLYHLHLILVNLVQGSIHVSSPESESLSRKYNTHEKHIANRLRQIVSDRAQTVTEDERLFDVNDYRR